MKLTIHFPELKALLPLAATDETRYVLNGIHVELSKSGRVLLVATDGRRLGVLHSQTAVKVDTEGKERAAFTIPSSLLKTIKTRGDVTVSYVDPNPPETEETESKSCVVAITAENDGITYQADVHAVKYPTWRMVIPRGPYCPAGTCSLNGQYLDDFRKVFKALGSSQIVKVYWQHGYEKHQQPYIIKGDSDSFLGALMPVIEAKDRDKAMPSLVEQPSWLDLPQKGEA